MKIKKYTYIMLAVLLFSGTACSDFLDKEYDATLSDEKVFTNQTTTREFLTDIYTNLPDGLAPLNDDQFTGASRDCMTDNATSYWGLHYYTKVATDSYTAKDHPLLGQWNTDFAGIRKGNIFLNNAQASVVGNAEKSGDDNKLYERYCNEARLLRALFHFDLVCWFGDMLIVGENEDGTNIVFSMENPMQMNQARTPAADVLQWVADECDKVKDALPFRYSNETTNWGRVNGATAYALKARAYFIRLQLSITLQESSLGGRLPHKLRRILLIKMRNSLILISYILQEILKMIIMNVLLPIRYIIMKSFCLVQCGIQTKWSKSSYLLVSLENFRLQVVQVQLRTL